MAQRVGSGGGATIAVRRAPDTASTVSGQRGPSTSLGLRLLLVAVFLMPLQLEIAAFKSVVDSRLPPGDLFLALSVVVAPTAVKFRRAPVALLPIALVATLAYGVVAAVLYAGRLSNHAFLVKFLGAMVLGVLCLVTITYARGGHAPRILRTWISGMAFWGLIAWIDWKVFDLVPFVEAKTASRFGGMQFDPNNAGAAFALAAVVMWRYGHRLYSSRPLRLVLGLGFVFFLGETLSRGGFVGLAAAIAVLLVVDHVSAARWIRYVAVAAIILVAAVGTGYVGNAVDDFERRPDNVGDREFKLADSVDQYIDSRGLGIGLGTYRLEQNGEVVHNTAVWLLSEMSMPGVVFFLAMTAIPVHAALRLRRVDRNLALALLGGHVVMVVTSVGIEALYQRHWWLIIGLLVPPATGRLRPAH